MPYKFKNPLKLAAIVMISFAFVLAGSFHAGIGAQEKPLKVALILPGLISDVGWNAAGLDGLQKAKEKWGKSVETAHVENVSPVAVEASLRDYASRGYDLILTHDFLAQDAIVKVAKDFPKLYFGNATGLKSSENAINYHHRGYEGCYLAGIMAGMMTKTNKIGIVGAKDIPSITSAHEAFKIAARKVNPNVKILDIYIGSFHDVAKAKEATLAQIDAGVDIVATSGNGQALGTIKAAEERKVLAIGSKFDQNQWAPSAVLTSVLYKWESAYLEMVEDIRAGKFGKRKYEVTIANGGIDLAPFHGLAARVPDEVKKRIEAEKKEIAEGKFTVPYITKVSR